MTGFFSRRILPPLPTFSKPTQAAQPQQKESTMDRFEKALAYVLENEGPYSNDPRDPGGATQFGIILTEYQDFLGKTLTPDDVKNMSLDTAKAIYQKKFWGPLHAQGYAFDSTATAIFDTAVNKGLGGCKVILEDTFQKKFDGEAWEYLDDLLSAIDSFGPKAFLEAFEPAVERYIDARIAKYSNMAWARKGWTNRAKRLLTLVAE